MEKRQSDLHAHLQKDWAGMWEQLRGTPFGRLPLKQDAILKKLTHLEELAHKIGGSVQRDVDKLALDIQKFLSGEMSLAEASRMMEHALRVEQDTREL